MKAEIVMDTGEKPVFVQYVERRIKHNKNFMMAITGPTGSGKTYSALRLGETLDPNFTIDNVCFYPEEFMSLLNEEKKPMPSGSVVVYEEAGVTLGHRDWHSVANRMIHYVLQTFRHRNLIVIFTVPDFSFFDASARKLMHCRAETMGIDQEHKQVLLKPLFLSVSQSTGKVYNIFLRYSGGSQVGGGKARKLERLRVGLPSKGLLREYEDRKRSFTDRLNAEIQGLLKPEEKQDEVSASDRELILARLPDRQREFLLLVESGLSVAQITEKMGYNTERGTLKKREELARKGFQFTHSGSGSDITYTVKLPSLNTARRRL